MRDLKDRGTGPGLMIDGSCRALWPEMDPHFFSQPRLCVLTASLVQPDRPGSSRLGWSYWQDFIEDCVLYLGTSWIPLHPFCPVFSALFSHVSLSCDYLVTTHVYVLERMCTTRFSGWAFLIQNINWANKNWERCQKLVININSCFPKQKSLRSFNDYVDTICPLLTSS